MLKPWKYMLFLALAVPAIYAYAPPSFKELAKPRWLTDISLVDQHVSRCKAARRGFRGRSDCCGESRRGLGLSNRGADEVDRRMARILSRSSRRAPRAIRPRGARHAGWTRGALHAGGRAGAGGWARLTQKFRSGAFLLPCHRRSPNAATLASDEICRGDEDRLQQLSSSPTSDGVIRLLIELRCEKLRPQLLRLAKRLDDRAPAAPPTLLKMGLQSLLPLKALRRALRPRKRNRERIRHRAHPASLRTALSQDGARTARSPRTCLRFFWLFSASSRGIRRPGEARRAADSAANGACFDRSGDDAGALTQLCRLQRRPAKSRVRLATRFRARSGFWPPSMDRVTPVI